MRCVGSSFSVVLVSGCREWERLVVVEYFGGLSSIQTWYEQEL